MQSPRWNSTWWPSDRADDARALPVLHAHSGTVEVIRKTIGPQINLQIIVVLPIAGLVANGSSQGTNDFLQGVSRGGLALQASTEHLQQSQTNAASRQVMDPEPGTTHHEPKDVDEVHLRGGLKIYPGNKLPICHYTWISESAEQVAQNVKQPNHRRMVQCMSCHLEFGAKSGTEERPEHRLLTDEIPFSQTRRQNPWPNAR